MSQQRVAGNRMTPRRKEKTRDVWASHTEPILNGCLVLQVSEKAENEGAWLFFFSRSPDASPSQ